MSVQFGMDPWSMGMPGGINQGNFMDSTVIGNNNFINGDFSGDQSFLTGDPFGGGMDFGMGGIPSYEDPYASHSGGGFGGGDDSSMMMIFVLLIVALISGKGGGGLSSLLGGDDYGGGDFGGDCDMPASDCDYGDEPVKDAPCDYTPTKRKHKKDDCNVCDQPADDYEDDPATNDADPSTAWGDPHIITKDGSTADMQIPVGQFPELLTTDDGKSSIVAEMGAWNAPELQAKQGVQPTVFIKKVATLDDGQKILMNTDGSASLLDAKGNAVRNLNDGETITSKRDANEKVTYSATNKTLDFTFVNRDGSKATGQVKSNVSYLDTTISDIKGKFGGLLAWLKDSFNGITVDPKNGKGGFEDPNMTFDVFDKKSLFA